MIKEVRKLSKTNRAKANYIRTLLVRGRIKSYKSTKGYIAYDTDELRTYHSNVKWGRPPKVKGE